MKTPAHLGHRLALVERAHRLDLDGRFSLADIASYLDCAPATAHRYVHAGRLLSQLTPSEAEDPTTAAAALSVVAELPVNYVQARVADAPPGDRPALIVQLDADARARRNARRR